MSTDDLKLEVLKLAASEKMDGKDASAVVARAKDLCPFFDARPTDLENRANPKPP